MIVKRTALVAAWLLAATGVVAAQAPQDWPSIVAASRRVEAIVRNEAGVPPDEQAAQLAALGDAALPALFALRIGLPLPSAGAEGAEPEAPVGAPSASGLALVALRALPPANVESFLVDLVAHAADPRRAIEALRVVGELGRASALDALARAAAAIDPLLQEHHIVAGTLRQAIAAICAADPRAADARLAPFLLALPEPLAAPALEAVAAQKGSDRTALWCDLLGKRDAFDRTLLAELELRPPLDPDGFERAAHLLRERAEAPEPELRRLVARALRRYPSLGTATTLVDLLDDSDDRVVEVARRSLAELSGITLPADREAWSAWVDAEEEWRLGPWREIEESLPTTPGPELLRLLASLARKRVHGDALAGPVGELLGHERREVRLAACEALGRLATPDCLEPLRRAVAEGDAELSASASRVLGRAGAM